VTAPAPDQQQPDSTATAEIAALLAALLAAGALVAATVAAKRALLATYEAGRIITVLMGLGVDRDVATAVLSVSLGRSPLPGTRRVAPDRAAARRSNQTVNLTRRAAYIVTAARRVHDGVNHPAGAIPIRPFRPTGFDPTPLRPAGPGSQPPGTLWGPEQQRERRQRLRDELERERRHWQQHLDAAAGRNRNAKTVDELAAVHGDQLTWVAIIDAKTSKYCTKANGTQFFASRRPPLGFPGDVHPSCRCKPGPPRRGVSTLTYDVDPTLEDHDH
jgi:SPP1 gp7 family putative phage head morphogenesis protein